MKKVTVFFFLLFAFAGVSSAQAQAFQQSDKLLNVGIGLGNYYAGGSLSVGASLEVGVTDQISVGGGIDYSHYAARYFGYRYSYNFYYIGARGSFHFGELFNINNDKFDPYAGLSLGFRAASYSNNFDNQFNDYNPYGGGVFLGIHAGARYMFSDKFGGFAELGYGVSPLKLGLAVKF